MIARRSALAGAPKRDRRGFTLVELMVAIMLLSVGMLALASSSAVVIRQMTEGGTMSVASSVAQTRIEKLRTSLSGCGPTPATLPVSSTGTATTRGVSESWTVTAFGTLTSNTRSAQISVTVTYFTRRGNRSQTYTSMVPCL